MKGLWVYKEAETKATTGFLASIRRLRLGDYPRKDRNVHWVASDPPGSNLTPLPSHFDQTNNSPDFRAKFSIANIIMVCFIYTSCKNPVCNWLRWLSGGEADALPTLSSSSDGPWCTLSHCCPGSRHWGAAFSLAIILNLWYYSFFLQCLLFPLSLFLSFFSIPNKLSVLILRMLKG
jgi:hypothetical protein